MNALLVILLCLVIVAILAIPVLVAARFGPPATDDGIPADYDWR